MAKQKKTLAKWKVKEAVTMATKLIDTWDKFARTRLNDIQEKEESYFGKVRPRSSGRSNFPVPVMARYVDEMKSRLDESPTLKIAGDISPSRMLIGKKAEGIINDRKKPSKGNWNKYDRNSRHLALFAGYNAVDFYSETVKGEFRLCFDPIDHTEFVFEAGGGNDLEKHSGVGRFPIWRTEGELRSRAEEGVYNPEWVEKLIAKHSTDFKKHDEYFKSKFERYKALGIDIDNNDYMGQQVYPLAQMQITMDYGQGPERFLLTFDYNSGLPVRFQYLEEVFPSGMYSIDLWQTHEDQNNVMCKAPVDDIFPFAEGIRVKVNQLFDNHTQRIYKQTGYDPEFVPDPSQLVWRSASQLVKMKSVANKALGNGIYEFKSEDMTGSTIEFIKWMDDFLTSVVGINPNDVSEDVQKVGILFGQIAKTSARMGIYNKSYREMWERLGYRALHEMKKFLKEKEAVKILGSKGAEWHDFVGSELEDPADFDILAEGSNVELEMSEARQKSQKEAISTVIGDPDLKKEVNPRWIVEQIFKTAQFSDEQVRAGMDVKNYGNEEMLARADLACEQILKGKTPEVYPGADDSFMQYIFDFANKLDKSESEMKIKLLTYGRAHIQFVTKNMASKGVAKLAEKGIPPDQVKAPLPPGMGGQQPPAQQPPKGPPMPSPAVHAKVKARGPKPLGHMPIPKVSIKGRHPSRKVTPVK